MDRTRETDPANTPPRKALQTNRPWLAVAGCLGGGFLGMLAFLMLAAAVVVVVVFFPQWLPGGGGGETRAFTRAVGELRKSPSLRVATREVAVRVDASVPTETTLRAWLVPVGPGWKVELGRTKVEVFAPGNIVQYIVPLGDDSRAVEAMAAVGEDGSWTVTLPPPRVDGSLVEVQSDPRRLRVEVDRDWVDHVVGDDAARDRALSMIRTAVIEEASAPTAMFEVREKSRRTVADMIRALLPDEHRARDIIVRWTDDPAAD